MRHGTADAPGCMVVLSNRGDAGRDLALGPHHAGRVYVALLSHRQDELTLDDEGRAVFPASHESVSVWVDKATLG